MEQIYGIDLSKEKFNVNFIDSKGNQSELEVKNCYSSICSFLTKLDPQVTLCVEHTGIYGGLLIFLSNSLNIKICAISGYELKHSLGLQKGKSDPIDARRIREYGTRFNDKLKEVYFVSEQLHELRELHTLRQVLIKQQKVLVTHLKEKNRTSFRSIQVNKTSEAVINILKEEIKTTEIHIEQIIEQTVEFRENSELLQSIIGIGPVTANELIIKTQNFKKIDTAKKAASFAGICPFPNSSGTMVKKSKISKLGDKTLKSLLFLCAASAVQYNKDMKYYYQRKIEEGKAKYLALNNVANKLLRTIYAILESREMYDPMYVCIDPRKIEKKVA